MTGPQASPAMEQQAGEQPVHLGTDCVPSVSGLAGFRASQALAERFHEAYERLAPQFGYETRPDTRAFDPQSANGRLMVAVCQELVCVPGVTADALARALAKGYSGSTMVSDADGARLCIYYDNPDDGDPAHEALVAAIESTKGNERG